MHLETNEISERPTDTHRFYGSATLDLINADPVTEGNRPAKFVSIELKRAYYTLRFAAENLSIGDSIKVETSNAKAFLIECTDATTSLSMSGREAIFSTKCRQHRKTAISTPQKICLSTSITAQRTLKNGPALSQTNPLQFNEIKRI